MLFKPVATFAIFALGAISAFALPAPENELKARAQPAGIAKIFADATTALTPHTNALQALTAPQLTTDTVTPIANEITTVLTEVINNVQSLAGQPASVVLASADGTTVLGIPDIAFIVSELVHLILLAVGTLLKFSIFEVEFILFEIGQLVGELVNAVIFTVELLLFDIEVSITKLLFDLEFVITDLGLTILGGLLGILL